MAPLNNIDDANQRDEFNRTLLHVNVYENRLSIVKELLQRGADVSLTSDEGSTPLHTAASTMYPHMIEVLLEYSSRDRVKKCINAKTTPTGNTALHVAATNGCIESVRHLLTYGASFEAKNRAGKRPIDVAIDPQVKNLLVNVELDSRLATNGNYLTLQSRMYNYSPADLSASVYARNNDGFTPLQMAVAGNHANTVHAIVDARVRRLPESTKDFSGMTEFVEAGKKVSDNQSALMLHSQDVHVLDGETISSDVGEILAGAHRIVKIANGVTRPEDVRLKWLAVVEETLEVLEFEPAHVTYDEKDRVVFTGQNARYYEMLHIPDDDYYEDYDNEAKIIAFMGILQVSVTQVIAAFMRSIFTRHLNISAKRNDFALFEKCMDEQNIDVNVVDADGRTPLHHAADNGNEEMMKLLFKKKARIGSQTKGNKETALHLAAAKGHEKIVEMLLRREKSRSFVDAKTRDEGSSALQLAAAGEHVKTMQVLLRHGAIYNSPGTNGQSPNAREFLAKVDQMFAMSREGNAKLLEHLDHLQRDELLAVGYARDNEGNTLEKVAGHRGLANSIASVVRKATPKVKEEKDEVDCDAAYYEVEGYQLLQTLASSRTYYVFFLSMILCDYVSFTLLLTFGIK